MTRDRIRNEEYFNSCLAFYLDWIEEDRAVEISSSEGRAMNASGLSSKAVKSCILRYSRGDAISEMRDSVLQMVELLALKQSTLANVKLEKDVRTMYERLDLNVLYESLTLLSFMVSLHFRSTEIRRVLDLIGHPGEDAILDQAALVFGDTSRKLGVQSKFPKVYDGLTEVISASPDQRPAKLKKFVESWYKKMKPISWHNNHDGAEGAYFGYWCFEAALVAMLFNIDDTAVLDHPNYPGDLTRHFRAAV